MKEAGEAYLDHIQERDQVRADWRSLSISSSIAKARAALFKGARRELSPAHLVCQMFM